MKRSEGKERNAEKGEEVKTFELVSF